MYNSLRRLLFALVFCGSVNGFGVGNPGDWLLSMGFGLSFGPSGILLVPQLEYVKENNLYVGPMLQIAPVGASSLLTAGGTVRLELGNHARIKPCVEGSLGLSALGSAFGIHLSAGMGVDYIIDRKITIGTIFRANLAPPAATFFVSWPLIVGRFVL